MTTRGTFLAPVLMPMASCFVNLPRAFIQTFLSAPDMAGTGSTILELSWETMEGYVQRVCVGWIGGMVKDGMRSDVIEISAEFARCIGLQEHLEKAPHSFLGVHVVEGLPFVRQINVDPCSPDDWELIQLHAGLLEAELLRQICVINDKQVIPIWVHQNTLIRIRVSLPVGIEHARLSTNSEVIVAPKERRQHTLDNKLDPDFYFEASSPLIVQKNADLAINESLDEIWLHPTTLALLDGAVMQTASRDTQDLPVIAIWSLESKSNADSQTTFSSDINSKRPKCVVGRLRASLHVGRGHVLLNDWMRSILDVSSHSFVQLRVVKLPELAPLGITLKVCIDENTADLENIRHAFVRWVDMLDQSVVVHSGSIVRFESANGDKIEALAEVDYDSEQILTEKQLEDLPIGAVERYALVGGKNGVLLSIDQVDVRKATDLDLRILVTVQSQHTPMSEFDRSILRLARNTKPYEALKKAIRSIILRDASTSRVLLGTKPPGSPLMFGNRGSGKSKILHSLLDELESNSQSLSFSIFVDCRNLRGLKMETVKSRLNEIFDDAQTHGPAVIALDNLDALVPEEEESAGAANEQARRIAEHLVVLMRQNLEWMGKATLELNASYKHELQVIKQLQSQHQQEARRELLATIGYAMQRKSVAVIATSRSDTSIHKSLRCCGLFDRTVQVTSPDAERREVLIREILQMKVDNATKARAEKAIQLDPSIDFGLLSSLTEGYSLRDLSSATDRALHQTFKRYALQTGMQCSGPMKVVQNDFVDGIQGFQPTALIGVDLFKSTVKWSDVGGLLEVRTVLKDTLELPTRYSKLYDNTPIKLPAGMLLYGPPGCGKTLLASAVANECGLNFISVKGPEVLNKYIGASEQAIRDLFARAASAAPSVLFLDEFDSIAPRRGADNTGVTDRLVNQLLTFLDGVEGRKGVYVLAATSRPDMIDPALLRPGRLDKSLYCGFPTEEERLDILRAVGKDMELAEDALSYLSVIAAAPKSKHFSGADLQALMYSAQLEIVHEKLDGKDSSGLIFQRHLKVAFENAKPSTSDAARRQFDSMYAAFSKARNTDFSIADADATATSDTLKSPVTHQRTALA